MKGTKMILKTKHKIHLHFIYTQPEGDFIGFLFFKFNIITLFFPFSFSPSNLLRASPGSCTLSLKFIASGLLFFYCLWNGICTL